MEPEDVARFAELENARWQPQAETRSDVAGTSSYVNFNDAVASDVGSWRAYKPLGSEDAVAAGGGLADISAFQATAVSQILVVSFRWLPDSENREYLLHLDCASLPSERLKPAESLLLETLVHVATRLGWGEQKTLPVSTRVSIVVDPFART